MGKTGRARKAGGKGARRAARLWRAGAAAARRGTKSAGRSKATRSRVAVTRVSP